MKWQHLDGKMTVAEALPRFFQHESHFFPVVLDGELIGLLRFRDLRGQPAETPIRMLARGPVRTIEARCTLTDTLELMIADGVYGFLVVEDHKLVGALSADDFLRIFSLLLKSPDHSVGQNFCFMIDPLALKYMVEVLGQMELQSMYQILPQFQSELQSQVQTPSN